MDASLLIVRVLYYGVSALTSSLCHAGYVSCNFPYGYNICDTVLEHYLIRQPGLLGMADAAAIVTFVLRSPHSTAHLQQMMM